MAKPEDAVFSPPPVGAVSRVDGVRLSPQEESNWCWAAVTQAVLRHGGKQHSQEELVTAHIQKSGRALECTGANRDTQQGGICSGNVCTAGCNDMHSIEAALSENGLLDRLLSNNVPPAFQDIQDEIKRKRPVPSKIRWELGDGHIILVVGWYLAANDKKCVVVLDPAKAKEGDIPEQGMLHEVYAREYRHPGKVGKVQFSYRLK